MKRIKYRHEAIFNSNDDERTNIDERMMRSALVNHCRLVREAREQRLWSNLRHLLVKDCNLLSEFSLLLIMALTNRALKHLQIESCRNLSGEFLNFCGHQLKVVRLKDCPSLQNRFLEDLVKIKKLLDPFDERANRQEPIHDFITIC